MSDNIFESDNQNSIPNTPSLADQLVGEGKKYSSVEELAKGKKHADDFIEQLKGELSSMRSEMDTVKTDLAARERLEDVLDKLASRDSRRDDDYDDSNRESNYQSGQPAISRKDIETLIEHKVTQNERDRTAAENRKVAVDKLKEMYGNDYTSKLNDVRESLGLDKTTLNNLAATSPKAFLELVTPKGSNSERPFSPPPTNTRSEAMGTSGAPAAPGTAEYYGNLKKTNPQLYRTAKVQAQLHKDAIRAANEGRPFDYSKF